MSDRERRHGLASFSTPINHAVAFGKLHLSALSALQSRRDCNHHPRRRCVPPG
jgi:hypothetical protein